MSDAVPMLLKNPKLLEKLLVQLDYERRLRIQAESERDREKSLKEESQKVSKQMEQRAEAAEAANKKRQEESTNNSTAVLALQNSNTQLIIDNKELQEENTDLRKDKWKYGLLGLGAGFGTCAYIKR